MGANGIVDCNQYPTVVTSKLWCPIFPVEGLVMQMEFIVAYISIQSCFAETLTIVASKFDSIC